MEPSAAEVGFQFEKRKKSKAKKGEAGMQRTESRDDTENPENKEQINQKQVTTEKQTHNSKQAKDNDDETQQSTNKEYTGENSKSKKDASITEEIKHSSKTQNKEDKSKAMKNTSKSASKYEADNKFDSDTHDAQANKMEAKQMSLVEAEPKDSVTEPAKTKSKKKKKRKKSASSVNKSDSLAAETQPEHRKTEETLSSKESKAKTSQKESKSSTTAMPMSAGISYVDKKSISNFEKHKISNAENRKHEHLDPTPNAKGTPKGNTKFDNHTEPDLGYDASNAETNSDDCQTSVASENSHPEVPFMRELERLGGLNFFEFLTYFVAKMNKEHWSLLRFEQVHELWMTEFRIYTDVKKLYTNIRIRNSIHEKYKRIIETEKIFNAPIASRIIAAANQMTETLAHVDADSLYGPSDALFKLFTQILDSSPAAEVSRTSDYRKAENQPQSRLSMRADESNLSVRSSINTSDAYENMNRSKDEAIEGEYDNIRYSPENSTIFEQSHESQYGHVEDRIYKNLAESNTYTQVATNVAAKTNVIPDSPLSPTLNSDEDAVSGMGDDIEPEIPSRTAEKLSSIIRKKYANASKPFSEPEAHDNGSKSESTCIKTPVITSAFKSERVETETTDSNLKMTSATATSPAKDTIPCKFTSGLTPLSTESNKLPHSIVHDRLHSMLQDRLSAAITEKITSGLTPITEKFASMSLEPEILLPNVDVEKKLKKFSSSKAPAPNVNEFESSSVEADISVATIKSNECAVKPESESAGNKSRPSHSVGEEITESTSKKALSVEDVGILDPAEIDCKSYADDKKSTEAEKLDDDAIISCALSLCTPDKENDESTADEWVSVSISETIPAAASKGRFDGSSSNSKVEIEDKEPKVTIMDSGAVSFGAKSKTADDSNRIMASACDNSEGHEDYENILLDESSLGKNENSYRNFSSKHAIKQTLSSNAITIEINNEVLTISREELADIMSKPPDYVDIVAAEGASVPGEGASVSLDGAAALPDRVPVAPVDGLMVEVAEAIRAGENLLAVEPPLRLENIRVNLDSEESGSNSTGYATPEERPLELAVLVITEVDSEGYLCDHPFITGIPRGQRSCLEVDSDNPKIVAVCHKQHKDLVRSRSLEYLKKNSIVPNLLMPISTESLLATRPEDFERMNACISEISSRFSENLRYIENKYLACGFEDFEELSRLQRMIDQLPRADFLAAYQFYPSIAAMMFFTEPDIHEEWILLAEITEDFITNYKNTFGVRAKDRDGCDLIVHIDKSLLYCVPIEFIENIEVGNTIAVLNGVTSLRLAGTDKQTQVRNEIHLFRTGLNALIEASRKYASSFDICYSCSGTSMTMRTCPRCEIALYCDRNCQRTDWNSGQHKLICPALPILLELVYVRHMPKLLL